MPGSPPINTIEPGTTPPPSTKSNSSRPVFHRLALEPWISRSRGVAAMLPPAASERVPPNHPTPPPPPPTPPPTPPSTRLLHSPHKPHPPPHPHHSAPHSVQR